MLRVLASVTKQGVRGAGVRGGLTRLPWWPPRHRTAMAPLASRSFASIAPAADGGGGSSNEDGGRSKD